WSFSLFLTSSSNSSRFLQLFLTFLPHGIKYKDNNRHCQKHCLQRKAGGLSMKHIVLTGGGTAGHVTPNIAMVPRLRELGYTISYIGSYDGIEKKLIEDMEIPYY